VDVAQALSDLTEISSQIREAVVVDGSGSVLGASGGSERLAEAGLRLLEEGKRAGTGEPTQLEASTHQGSVFVLRDGGRTIVATTGPEPTVGLVFYDLKSALRNVKPKPRPRAKPAAKKPAAKKPPAKKPAPPRTRKKPDAS
jgi:predicted regulator of Ras-like GTPase activity (Roadblock/LC7/MglB family)